MADRSRNASCIVVTDDDELIRLVLRAALEREGFAVVEAEDGATAVERARFHLPVAVILDARMPGASLAETLDSLREDRADLPILVLSGQFTAPPEASAPHTAFLTKPVDTTVLLDAITDLIGAGDRG